MFDIKALYEAFSVEEATRLLLEHPEARVMAGGSDNLIKIREGKLANREFVSIYMIDELREIKLEEDGTLRLGSLCSFTQVASDPLVLKLVPTLAKAVSLVGGPQVRNIGTIGGNTCNGITSADSGATLVAYDAEVELHGAEGLRRLPLRDFYKGVGKVDLRPGEIQVAIRIPRSSYEGYVGEYIKYAMREAMDIATLSCSVNLRLSEDKKTVEDLRIAYGVAAPVPTRALAAEAAGRGQPLDQNFIPKVLAHITEGLSPRESWRASQAFRLHLIKATAKRALETVLQRSGVSLG